MTPEIKGNYVNGKFQQTDEPSETWTLVSPADLDDEVGEFFSSFADVDHSVEAARSAFHPWRKLSFEVRAEFLKKYQSAVEKRSEDLAQAISREMGKPMWESQGEVKAMLGKVGISIEDGMKLVAEKRYQKILPNADGRWSYKPLGVLSVIGPFNFPGHLPNGHFVPALLCGNTIVFKPSEKTPLVGQVIAECFHEAGLPPGVFNMIQGEKETGRRLCVHKDVDGVLFTGSYEVGNRIQQDTLTQYWKLIALEMGGKNAAIVLDDADMELALRECLVGAYITTGQRCSCTSRIFVHESKIDLFVERFHEMAKKFKIGHPTDNPFMGPLIDRTSMDRYIKFQGIASREGAKVVMNGKPYEGTHSGHYVTPSVVQYPKISLVDLKKSVYLQTEIFGPTVGIVPFASDSEAIEFTNSTAYGLVASVFSSSRDRYDAIWEDLRTGLVNWNKSTVGASSKLPFGGLKKSGNFFPSGVTASAYCTFPVASVEVAKPSAQDVQYPGLDG